MMPEIEHSLLVVEWIDITVSADWIDTDSNHAERVIRCKSVGWKIQETDECLTIAGGTHKGGQCICTQVIPQGCIKNIKELNDTSTVT